VQEIPTPEQAAAHPYSAAELDLLRATSRTEVVGSAEQVDQGLDELAARFGVREMIISTRAYGLAAKAAVDGADRPGLLQDHRLGLI